MSTVSDLLARTPKAVGGSANPKWRPVQVDDAIGGTIAAAKFATSKIGRTFLLTIDAELCVTNGETLQAGRYDVWASQKMLAESLMERAPRPGDTILIRLDDIVKTKAGSDFKVFAVALVDPDGTENPRRDPLRDVEAVATKSDSVPF